MSRKLHSLSVGLTVCAIGFLAHCNQKKDSNNSPTEVAPTPPVSSGGASTTPSATPVTPTAPTPDSPANPPAAEPSSTAVLTVAPSSGAIGTILTLTGMDLASVSAVTVDNIPAVILSHTAAKVTAMVMPGTTTGAVKVTTTAATVTSSANFTVTATGIPTTQQGSKLIGATDTGPSHQGWAVAVSADGTTMVSGGYDDDSGIGAIWIFTRSGTTWTPQGSKLVGTGGAAGSYSPGNQGNSVAISADGNTVIEGAYDDALTTGAVWVFTRDANGAWTQQGDKLVGKDNGVAPTNSAQSTVALSADGNTAFIGGSGENSGQGATWVFTRSNGAWTQSAKLVGTGGSGAESQGVSLAASADGRTVLVGGYGDTGTGSVWVFYRDGDTWGQEGTKLTPNDAASGYVGFGGAVGLSADGNNAVIGGNSDAGNIGAAWIFERSNHTWTQKGTKLTPSDMIGALNFGNVVAISADGRVVAVGKITDENDYAAAWVFTTNGTAWTQHGSKLTASGATVGPSLGEALSLSADGSVLAVGGSGDDSNVGATWVFVP